MRQNLLAIAIRRWSLQKLLNKRIGHMGLRQKKSLPSVVRWPLFRSGRCGELSIRVKCMDRCTIGEKNTEDRLQTWRDKEG